MISIDAMKRLSSPTIIGALVIIVSLGALALIDDLSSTRRGAALVALVGPLGALWIFRLFCVLFILGALLAIWNDLKSQRRIDQLVARRNIIDRSIHRKD